MFSFIKNVFYGVVCGVIILIGLLYFLYFINILVLRIKGTKFPKRKSKSEYKKRNILVILFYDLPRALARDFMERNPDAMNIHGCFFFAVLKVREKLPLLFIFCVQCLKNIL